MKKNPHSRILKGNPKKQYLSTVPKSCHFLYIYVQHFPKPFYIKYYKIIFTLHGQLTRYNNNSCSFFFS